MGWDRFFARAAGGREGKGRQEAKAAAQLCLFIINIGPDVQTQ